MSYPIQGQNNRIILTDGKVFRDLASNEQVPGLDLSIIGANNKIVIEFPQNMTCVRIAINGSDANIEIQSAPYLRNLLINTTRGNHQRLLWGRGSTTHNTSIYLNEEAASVLIGKDCMFASETSLWPTDGHVLYDAETDEILNPINHPIVIGDHCWIGCNVAFTKNASLAAGSVVGMGSVVTKPFDEEKILVAGYPARILRRNIAWDRITADEALVKKRQGSQ
jgi:hypothetical protein